MRLSNSSYVREEMYTIIKEVTTQFMDDEVRKRLKTMMNSDGVVHCEEVPEDADSEDTFRDEELAAISVVRDVVSDLINGYRFSYVRLASGNVSVKIGAYVACWLSWISREETLYISTNDSSWNAVHTAAEVTKHFDAIRQRLASAGYPGLEALPQSE